MSLAPSTATRFALVGSAIASAIAVSVFGWFWIYLPGGLLALGGIYWVSSKLDRLAKSKVRGIPACLAAGVGVAIAVLEIGVVSFGAMGVFLAWLDDVTPLRTGAGPFTSIWDAIEDFILKPLIWVSLLGGWIAILMGIAYGVLLHRGVRRNAVAEPGS